MTEISKTVTEFLRKMAEDAKSGKPQNYEEFLKRTRDLSANAEKYHQDILDRTRKANEKAAEHFAQMHANSESCVVHGECRNSFCNATRLWLSYLIYDRKLCQVQKQFRPFIEEVTLEWLRPKDKDEAPEHDYRGRYYESRSGNCHPSVIFRGTVPGSQGMFEGVAVYVKISIAGIYTLFEKFMPLGNDEESKRARDKWGKSNFYKITLLDETHIVFSEQRNKGDIYAYVPFPVHATIILYAKKKGKCWATNVAQAFGKSTFHYPRAQKFSIKIAKKIDAENAENVQAAAQQGRSFSKKKLHFAGHSMGGGLAVAAAQAAQTACPNLDIYAAVYNAAGVHPNTVEGMRHVSFFTDAVNDEILTTAQSYPEKFPFFASILRLAHINPGLGFKLPQAGAPAPHPPLYPNPVADAMPDGDSDPDKCPAPGRDRYDGLRERQPMPKLFPLSEQALIKGQRFPEITKIDTMLKSSVGLGDFVNKFLRYIEISHKGTQEEKELPLADYLTIIGKKYIDMIIKTEGSDLQEILAATVDYHGMDVAAESIFLGSGWTKPNPGE